MVYSSYKSSREPGVLADYIRTGGLTNVPWPYGLAEDLAALLDQAYPWTTRKQTAADDTWIFFIYWRETEFRDGRAHKTFRKKALREVLEWFEARGTPKNYETIRTRLREGYQHWRESISVQEIEYLKEMLNEISEGGEER